MKELIKETNINSEVLLRTVIMSLKSVIMLESDAEVKIKLKTSVEKLEIVLERLVNESNKSTKDKVERDTRKCCGTCLYYVRNHSKKGHTKGCKIKKDYYPQPENDACKKWRSKGIGQNNV